MKAKYLFPHYFRIIGLVMAVPGFVLGYFNVFQEYNIPGFELRLHAKDSLFTSAIENYTNELALALVIIGLIFIAFSKIKQEDELTGKLRLNALYWGILVNYAIWFAVLLGSYIKELLNLTPVTWLDPLFKDSRMLVYNLFLPLTIFIARFYYLLYKDHQTYEVHPLRFLSHAPYSFIGKTASVVLFVSFLFIRDIDSPAFVLLPVGLLIWAYTRERNEDELINAIRLDAMQIAVYVNYAVLMVANLCLYDFDFLLVLYLNLITIPVIFLLVFYFRLWRLKRNDAGGRHLTLRVF